MAKVFTAEACQRRLGPVDAYDIHSESPEDKTEQTLNGLSRYFVEATFWHFLYGTFLQQI